jgi:hypothetical protein
MIFKNVVTFCVSILSASTVFSHSCLYRDRKATKSGSRSRGWRGRT